MDNPPDTVPVISETGPAPVAELEQDFVRCALVLFRKNPLTAQAALLAAFADRLESES
jgi:hypothetical protein